MACRRVDAEKSQAMVEIIVDVYQVYFTWVFPPQKTSLFYLGCTFGDIGIFRVCLDFTKKNAKLFIKIID